MFKDLLERWAAKPALKAALREEFEQAGLRIIVSIGVGIFVFTYLKLTKVANGEMHEAIIAAGLFYIFAIGIFARVVYFPHESMTRRVFGILADNAILTYCLLKTGEAGALILTVSLFVTMGNGMRFVKDYLRISQLASIIGFGFALLVSPFWYQHVWYSVGFLLTLLAIPWYAAKLTEGMRKSEKRADEANEAKGRFLANVSHEMRTPLNGVVAMSDVLRETSLTESQREIVDTLGTSANLLLAQIEDVLDMAKIEAGKIQIERLPFDLGGMVTSTVKVILPQARYKRLVVNTEISPQVAGWFSGDSHRLRQVLLNLVANAVKFTERGEIVIRVSESSSKEESTRIRFEVKDTGIGIPPEKQATIFEPFTQADDTITRKYGGTGLGTAIARQLVDAMGGEVGLVSTQNVGSVFWFEVPLPKAQPIGLDLADEVTSADRLSSTIAAFAAQQPGKVTRIRGARVLVAEDNPTNQRVAQMILESAGHIATIVNNGEAALDALERGSFDLALFDLSMPLVSGLEALKLYKYTTQKPIPILILSANVTTEIIAECQRAGCAEFLPKPIRPTTLLDAIERHLEATTAEQLRASPPLRGEERPTLTVVDTPAVDMNVLADLNQLSSDTTFIERLLLGFKKDTHRIVKDISTAMAERRYEAVRDAAHALKGGAGGVGATQLVQIALRFESATHDQMRLKAAAWMQELAHAADVALAALEAYLEERRRQLKN